MILHSIPDQWASPLSDILSMLQQLSGPGRLQPQFITLLLEILCVLPEEVNTFTCESYVNKKNLIMLILLFK